MDGGGTDLVLWVLDNVIIGDSDSASGTIAIRSGEDLSFDPLELSNFLPGVFAVASGPCVTTDGGRCVGWPGTVGCAPCSESCSIKVRSGGRLGECTYYDMSSAQVSGPIFKDYITIGAQRYGNCDSYRTLGDVRRYGISTTGCPAGVALGSGDSIGWISDESNQGNNQGGGLSYSSGRQPSDMGGGWLICFEA